MRSALLALALLAGPVAVAQSTPGPVRAATEDGRTILVYSDGTWRLDRSAAPEIIELDLRDGPPPPAPPPPAPPSGAMPSSRTLTSASEAYAIDYDPTVWSTPSNRINAEAEFELTLPFSGGYALAIYEAFPASSKQVRDMVLANAQLGTGSPVTLLSERPFRVPGGEGIQIEFEAVAENGLEFVFITSAFGTDQGSLQITTFTSKSASELHRPAMLDIHDGIRLLKPGK